jgi:hypothetical protein
MDFLSTYTFISLTRIVKNISPVVGIPSYSRRAANPDIMATYLPSLFIFIKKLGENVLIYKEVKKGSGAKTYMRKDFLIKEIMHEYLVIYEEDFSHVRLCTGSSQKILFLHCCCSLSGVGKGALEPILSASKMLFSLLILVPRIIPTV